VCEREREKESERERGRERGRERESPRINEDVEGVVRDLNCPGVSVV